MHRHTCLFCFCLLLHIVQIPVARGADASPGPATIEVENRLPVELRKAGTDADSSGWLKIPEYLRGAKIHAKPSRNLSTVLKRRFACTVKQPGVLLLAATWDEPPKAGGSWRKKHFKPKKLLEEGWTAIDTMQHRSGEETIGYTIFRRIAAAGDEYEFHTSPVHAPLAIVLDSDQVAKALARPAIVAASNPIVALDPPDDPAPKAASDTLLLDAHEHRGFANTYNWTDMFSREVARQAILVAAREELGLSTRDGMLREEFPTDESGLAARSVMVIKRHLGGICETTVTIFHRDGDRYVADWEGEWKHKGYRVVHQIAVDAEKMSRTEFPALLRSLGYEGKPIGFREHAPVPADIERKLAYFSIVSQFAAVRDLHALAKREGSSPEILSGLSRGYANLSVLTNHLWSPAYDVFKARALIYAERRLAKDGDDPTPESLFTRGYARAMAGMFYRSEKDFAAASSKLAAIDKSRRFPEWADVVWAFVKYDNEKLLAAEDSGGQRSLARMLRLLALQGTSKVQPLAVVKAVGRMMELVPNCDRASEMLHEIDKWEIKRPVILERRRYFARTLYPSLEDLRDAPAAVAEIAKSAESESEDEDIASESRRRRKLIDALKQAGRTTVDRGEPSLDCLGQIIQEVGFLHAMQLFWYRTSWQQRDPGEEFQALQPTLEGHPYYPYALMWEEIRDGESQQRIVAEFVPTLLEPSSMAELVMSANGMYSLLHQFDPPAKYWQHLNGPARLHRNRDVFRELLTMIEDSSSDRWRNSMMRSDMAQVGPHMPFTVAFRIQHDWKRIAGRLDSLEKQYRHDPIVLLRLGEQYLERDRLDDAQRVLERCIELDGTWEGYRRLASVRWKQKDYDGWKDSTEQYLEYPFEGLERAMTRVRLAKYRLLRNDPEKALEHAVVASRSNANWALLFAAMCEEEVGRQDEAEEYLHNAAQVYENFGSTLHWLGFCWRTGHGNLQTSRDFARKHLEAQGVLPPDQLQPTAAYYLYIDEPENALEVLRYAYEKTKRPFEGMLAAIIADDLDESRIRDDVLRQVAETKKVEEDMRLYVDLAKLLRRTLADDEKTQLDSEAIETLAKQGKLGQPTFVWYAAGRFLANRDRPKEADRYLLRAARSPRWLELSTILAWKSLRDREIEIGTRRYVEIPGQDPDEPTYGYSPH